MNNSNEIKQQMDQAVQDLVETTFGEAVVGRSYLTPAGHRVEVIEVVPDSHAIVVTATGREMKILANKTCRGPLPVQVDVTKVTDPDGEQVPKRKRDMTVEELQAEYLRVVGRTTQSRDRRYLRWRLSAGGLRRIPVGPLQKRAARDKADIQVLPIGLLRDTVAKLDAATKEMGFKSRSALIRAAVVALLHNDTTDAAHIAADAIEAETRA